MGMPSRRTNNFPESGRGLGHVTPTIFGSTVGYPSDSLASCYLLELTLKTQVFITMNTVGISSNALFGIQLIFELHLSLDAKLLSTFDLLC